MHHNLKTWPVYFSPAESGDKPFEIRDNSDRDFQKGDTVTLKEYDPFLGRFTGRELEKRITFVTEFAQQPGIVVFGVEDVDAPIKG